MDINQNVPSPRIPLNISVEFKRNYARAPVKGVLRNISLTGAFLQHGDQALKTNDKIAIVFEVSGRIRRVQAYVIWCNEVGSGIKFKPFNNRDVQIVDDLMYFVQTSRDSFHSVLDNIFKKVS